MKQEISNNYAYYLLDCLKFFLFEIQKLVITKNVTPNIYLNENLNNYKKAFSSIDFTRLFRFNSYKIDILKETHLNLDTADFEFRLIRFTTLAVFIISQYFEHSKGFAHFSCVSLEMKYLVKLLIFFTNNLKLFELKVISLALNNQAINKIHSTRISIVFDEPINLEFVEFLLAECKVDPDTQLVRNVKNLKINTALNWGLWKNYYNYSINKSFCLYVI